MCLENFIQLYSQNAISVLWHSFTQVSIHMTNTYTVTTTNNETLDFIKSKNKHWRQTHWILFPKYAQFTTLSLATGEQPWKIWSCWIKIFSISNHKVYSDFFIRTHRHESWFDAYENLSKLSHISHSVPLSVIKS